MAGDHKDSHFRISLPSGWEDQTIYTYKGPDDSGVQHNLVLIIDSEVGGVDLGTYAKLRLDSIKDTLTGFELMGEREKTLKSGNKAFELVYKWSPSADKTLVQKQVFQILDHMHVIQYHQKSKGQISCYVLQLLLHSFDQFLSACTRFPIHIFHRHIQYNMVLR